MSADAQTPPAADAPPSKGKALVPFILALVIGLAAGAGSGLFVVGPAMAKGIAPVAAASHKPKKDAAEADDEASDEAAAADDEEEGGDDEEAPKDEKKGEHGGGEASAPVYTLDNLVLNPAQSGGTRFLLLSITFETSNAKLLEDMKARDAELRDVVLVTLGAKTVEQLADMKTRDGLKAELSEATKNLLKAKKKVPLRVYFPQFVIQ